MKEDLNSLSSKELIDIYNKVKEFENFLDKEAKNIEKMRDTNE